jgi:imidazole glycerol-phosphate synthase subunit HisH
MNKNKNNKICIIDYDVGNLLSVKRSIEIYGPSTVITNDREEILSSSKVVLPGVGAFKKAMNLIRKYSLQDIISEVVEKKIPLLGICLGMQLLFEESYEFGKEKGLGFIKGSVKKLPEKNKTSKIPSIGWNELRLQQSKGLFKNIEKNSYVYFLHSYMAAPTDKSIITSTYDFYGYDVVASVKKDNIYGCQFHPEKSGEVGLNIIKNFTRIEL